jgi:hypothetical protein
MFQTLKYIPSSIEGIDGEILGILGFSLLGLLLVVTPFIVSARVEPGRRSLLPVVGVLVVGYILVLSALAYLT